MSKIKSTTRKKLIHKLLPRARKADVELHKKALKLLGCKTENPTESDLEALLKSDEVTSEAAQSVIDLLEDLEGPEETISPRITALHEFWQKQINAVEGLVDTQLISRARELTTIENIHLINWKGDIEISRQALYMSLTGITETEYNRHAGMITGINPLEYQERIIPLLDLARRRVVLDMFMDICPDDPLIRSIRLEIKSFLYGPIEFADGMQQIQRSINSRYGIMRDIYSSEFLILMTLFAAGRKDYLGVSIFAAARKRLDFKISEFEELRSGLLAT